jgi:hypothetical protein
MKAPRFILTDSHGLILEAAIPLTLRQREAARSFAEREYRRRLVGLPSGDRRDALVRVIEKLIRGDFTERAVPAYDFDKEVILHG